MLRRYSSSLPPHLSESKSLSLTITFSAASTSTSIRSIFGKALNSTQEFTSDSQQQGGVAGVGDATARAAPPVRLDPYTLKPKRDIVAPYHGFKKMPEKGKRTPAQTNTEVSQIPAWITFMFMCVLVFSFSWTDDLTDHSDKSKVEEIRKTPIEFDYSGGKDKTANEEKAKKSTSVYY